MTRRIDVDQRATRIAPTKTTTDGGAFSLYRRCIGSTAAHKFRSAMSLMGYVWTAPTGQGILLAFCLRSGASHVSGLFVQRS